MSWPQVVASLLSRLENHYPKNSVTWHPPIIHTLEVSIELQETLSKGRWGEGKEREEVYILNLYESWEHLRKFLPVLNVLGR